MDLLSFFTQQGVNMTQTAIPITVTMVSETNWTQFYLTLALALLSSIFVLPFMFTTYIKPILTNVMLKLDVGLLKKMTGRNIMVIRHTLSGLFGGSMIDTETLMNINKGFWKFKGKPFDLVLHTPGGDIFSAMFISRLLKNYPGDIRIIIPLYAMSGGTLLALSGKRIAMSRNACLGPVDPQIGSLFKAGSARSWKEILKIKGKKAEDQSISFAFMGEQYTKSIRNHIATLIEGKINPNMKETFLDKMTSGNIEHAYPLTMDELKSYGFNIEEISPMEMKVYSKIINSSLYEGVHYL